MADSALDQQLRELHEYLDRTDPRAADAFAKRSMSMNNPTDTLALLAFIADTLDGLRRDLRERHEATEAAR
jgi:hypothetical protein